MRNLGFAEGSGYGSYPFGMNVWRPDNIADQPYGTVHYQNNSKSYATTVKNNATNLRIKFRLRGLPKGKSFLIRTFDMNYLNTVLNTYTYTENGIHEFVYNDPNKPVRIILYNGTDQLSMSEFYLDIIPDHEGYLVTDGVDDMITSSAFQMGKDFTIVGEWTLLQNINVSSLRKQSSFIIRNNDLGLSLFINRISHPILIHTKSLRAFCSNGVLYKSDWTEQIDTTPQDITSSNSELLIAGRNNNLEYDKIAFKNLAIYPTVLSKDECIKAYNYLQTLKAK